MGEAPAQNAPAVEADLQERVDSFNKELQALLGKYELALTAAAVISDDGRIGAIPRLLSARELAKAKKADEEAAKSAVTPA